MSIDSKTIITIKDLTVVYDKKPILWDVDLEIPQNSLCCIAGPNGGGKTTLLKTMLGIIKPITGMIFIDNTTRKQNIAYVPQRNSVDWNFPILVDEVVMMGRYPYLSWWQKPQKKDFEIVDWALEQVNLTHLKKRHIAALSGGQQQRVFLARAFAQQADIFIMDEPFSAIDAQSEKLMFQLLKTMQNQGKTIVMVHHNLMTIQQYFDWTMLLNVKHIAFGPTKQVMTETNLYQTFHQSQVFNHDLV